MATTIAFTDGSIRPWEDAEAKKIFWHSSAHLMAEALEAIYPGVKFGVGPAVETGFYYDVDLGENQISEADLKAIEKKIKNELKKMLTAERTKYEKLFDSFGLQLKFGVYTDYGMHKDALKDLLMFTS